MKQFSESEKEQGGWETAFEDCGQENPFEEGMEEDQEEADEAVEGTAEELQQDEPDKEAEPEDHNADEEKKRAEHEAAEEKRRQEWEARQQAKREGKQAQLARIAAMNEEELTAASTKRVGTDTEKLTRRNMKESVSEYIQTLCFEDTEFARLTLHPEKNMIRCFQYINRKAYEYVQDEMKANGIRPGGSMQGYGSDIPDDLCYHWAEEYFRTADVKEDREEEEKFVPRPYMGGSKAKPKGKKTERKKAAEKKPQKGKQGTKSEACSGQLSFLGQMSLDDMALAEVKAG